MQKWSGTYCSKKRFSSSKPKSKQGKSLAKVIDNVKAKWRLDSTNEKYLVCEWWLQRSNYSWDLA